MKKLFSIKSIVLCMIALVGIVFTASAVGICEVQTVFGYQMHEVQQAGFNVAAVAVITSSNLSEQIIQDFKVKFGKIKILTVVLEYEVSHLQVIKPEVRDEHGVVIEAEVTEKVIDVPEESYQFVIRRPDRSHMKMFMSIAVEAKTDPAKNDEYNESIIKNLIVGGDLDALDDGKVYLGVCSQLKNFISPQQSFLANA